MIKIFQITFYLLYSTSACKTTDLRISKFESFYEHAQLKFYKPPFRLLDLYIHVKN